ncbi:RxLR effector candidate protein [Phytophthora cinnamomi]|uniref:RxLR effector candidate protein n=1 Tax=Phytophthora cinnamomi TaxID=4785 RepID=UPI003559871B|nr:RxLR effector candidate protein [Phytophthora cinnamomi]
MVAVWPKHKADCKNVVNARRQLELAGKTVSGVPCSIGAETLARLNRLSLFVYDKYDITEPPGRGSKMDVDKKLAFFLEMLKAHDTSSSENKNLPLPEKLFLNRRYNNTYNHIGETFTPSELARFHALMRVHHVGLSNQS